MRKIQVVIEYTVILLLTTCCAGMRIYLDIRRYQRTHDRSTLFALAAFILAWFCFLGAIGCYLWAISQTLDYEVREKKIVHYLPTLGVGLGEASHAIKPYDSSTILQLIYSNRVQIEWQLCLAQFLPVATQCCIAAADIIKLNVMTYVWLQTSAIWFAKASFFITTSFSLRNHLSPRLLWASRVLGIYLLVSYIGVILLICLTCVLNLQGIHSSTNDCGVSAYPKTIGVLAALSISSDIYVMAVPVSVLRTLRLKRRDKYTIVLLVFLGISTITTTAARTVVILYFRNPKAIHNISRANTEGPSLPYIAQLLNTVEPAVALLSSSLLSLHSALHRKRRVYIPKRKDGTATIGGSGVQRRLNFAMEDEIPSFRELDQGEDMHELFVGQISSRKGESGPVHERDIPNT